MAAQKPKLYNLPGDLAAALHTNRPELLLLSIGKFERMGMHPAEGLTGRDAANLYQLIGDLIADRERDQARIRRMERTVREVSAIARGLESQADKLTEMLATLGTDTPIEED